MCRWAGSSEGAVAARRALAAVLLLALASSVPAKVFLTVDEALRLAFPGASLERHTAFLTEAQTAAARALAGVEIPTAMVTYYIARREGKEAGAAYLDTHTVRTLPETLLVVLDPSGSIRRVEVLSFSEPEEYLPRGPWYAQFQDRKLDPDLSLTGAIRPVTGATLTARATTEAVRRVLAIHRVLRAGTRL